MLDLEGIICKMARIYRTVNKPFVRSDINMKHELYADETEENPALTVSVNGKPECKLMDMIVLGGVVAIFVATVCKILRWLMRD